MQTGHGRALAALLPCGDIRRVKDALAGAGFELTAVASSTDEVLRLLDEHRPELLLADAVLPGGDGVSLARRINAAALTVYPAVLLMAPAGMALPEEAELSGLGAIKISKPAASRDISEAYLRLRAREALLPPDKAERLSGLMDALGLPAHPGRDMLAAAAAIVWRDRRRLHNLRDGIYPAAGRAYEKSGAQAERAIRHAIEVAWRTGEIEQQHRIFGDTIDARRGRPTCGEMIAQLADILRWEG